MNQQPKPPVWKIVKEAVEAMGGKTTNVAVRDWILERYAGTNLRTISCQIIKCTVNHSSRIHYAENQKPRRSENEIDFLFRPADGQLEWYEPTRHGIWEIAEREDGSFLVRERNQNFEDEEVNLPDDKEVAASGNRFAAEAHLRDYLAGNLSVIEDGLQLFVDETGSRDGVEYPTEMGRIDILAVDKNGGLLVIELKVDRGPDQVCGQIMRYVGWVKRHLANGKPVRGLIIAKHISDRIRYAIADVRHVSACEYQLQISLTAVEHIDPETNLDVAAAEN